MRATRGREGWDLLVDAGDTSVEIPDDLEVAAWPATLSDHRALLFAQPAGGGLVWSDLE